MKKIIAMAAAGLLAMVLVGCGGGEADAAFDEDALVGQTVAAAADVIEANDYECTVISQTGAELNNDFSKMNEDVLNRWYVYECEADHGDKTVIITIISEDSALYDEIK